MTLYVLIPRVITAKYVEGGTVNFRCPYCGRSHTHGFTSEMLSINGAPRFPHCAKPQVDHYFITVVSLPKNLSRYQVAFYRGRDAKARGQPCEPPDDLRSEGEVGDWLFGWQRR